MRKLGLFFALLIVLAALPGIGQAQDPQPVNQIETRLAGNAVLRTGPGFNTGWYEYLARGRNVIATGRDTETQWIEINVGHQFFGWVPANSLERAAISYTLLPVKPGLRSTGNGAYPVDHPALRAVEVDMIALQRPLQQIAARYSRLQGFLNASCESIPAIPPVPQVTAGDIAMIPELETFRIELGIAHTELSTAITRFQEICTTGRGVNESVYLQGLTANNNALTVLKNLRLYLNILTGLESVIS